MIYGLPAQATPPKYYVRTFYMYIPKLKGWSTNPDNAPLFKRFIKTAKDRLNYAYWGDDWEQAVSLLVAHQICITDPSYVQSTGPEPTSGGVMSSRSVDSISYAYELDKSFDSNPAYLYYNQTGYGRQLVALSLTRGYIGMVISD